MDKNDFIIYGLVLYKYIIFMDNIRCEWCDNFYKRRGITNHKNYCRSKPILQHQLEVLDLLKIVLIILLIMISLMKITSIFYIYIINITTQLLI